METYLEEDSALFHKALRLEAGVGVGQKQLKIRLQDLIAMVGSSKKAEFSAFTSRLSQS